MKPTLQTLIGDLKREQENLDKFTLAKQKAKPAVEPEKKKKSRRRGDGGRNGRGARGGPTGPGGQSPGPHGGQRGGAGSRN